MATFYLDSSALVKLYITEIGSAWVDATVNARGDDARPTHVIAVSKIGVVEVVAAIARRERLGQLDAEQQALLVTAFLRDCSARIFTLAPLDEQLRLAVALAQRQSLRGYDAVHLSAALDLHRHLLDARLAGLTFVSADAALCAAALAEGLTTVNPNDDIAAAAHTVR